MLRHPAHVLALGFGSGLSPKAPGTVGTLWAWVSFALLSPWMNDARWGVLIAVALAGGVWACAVTARNLGTRDPSCIVWDEVVAFWMVLWLVTPTDWDEQLLAFGLFRLFDIAKPGPVGWADNLFHGENPATTPWGWTRAGWAIMLDDLVAAACTLLVIALWRVW
jgi:phosphatidylglycerophosphatase A